MCQKLYVSNDVYTQLFADANIRIQLYMRVYNCVSILMCVKSCMYPIIHVYKLFADANIRIQLCMPVYNCVNMFKCVSNAVCT